MKQYLDMLRTIRERGVIKTDRTGVGTRSIFGYQCRYDLSEGFPLYVASPLKLETNSPDLIMPH